MSRAKWSWDDVKDASEKFEPRPEPVIEKHLSAKIDDVIIKEEIKARKKPGRPKGTTAAETARHEAYTRQLITRMAVAVEIDLASARTAEELRHRLESWLGKAFDRGMEQVSLPAPSMPGLSNAARHPISVHVRGRMPFGSPKRAPTYGC